MAKREYNDLQQEEKYRLNMLLKEIKLLKELQKDADACTKEEMQAELRALTDEVNNILSPSLHSKMNQVNNN